MTAVNEKELKDIIAELERVERAIGEAVYRCRDAREFTAYTAERWGRFHLCPRALFTLSDQADLEAIESALHCARDTLDALLSRLERR